MTDLTPEIIEKALAALLDKGMAEPESVDYYIGGGDQDAHEVIEAVLSAVADDLRAEGAAEAWDEGAQTAWDRSTPEVNGQRYHWRHEGEPTNPYRKEADHDH